MKALEELKELRRQIDTSIASFECRPPGDYVMSDAEVRRYQKQYGAYDFIIGDFKITRIRARIDFRDGT